MGLGPKLMQPTTGCLGKAISEWLELGCMGCGWGGDAGDTTVGPWQRSCGVQAAWQGKRAVAMDVQRAKPEQAEGAAVGGEGKTL